MKKSDLLLKLTLCPHPNSKLKGVYSMTIIGPMDVDLSEDEFIDRFIRPMVSNVLNSIVEQ